MTDQKFLLWVDLETTCLVPRGGRILEIAAILTDYDLKEISRFHSLVHHSRRAILLACDDYVLQMHLNTGLIQEIGKLSVDAQEALSQQNVGLDFHAWIDGLPCNPKNINLAGSTVGFDKSWIEEHWPYVMNLIHYRVLDVSSLLLAWPELADRFPKEEKPDTHRAMVDIEASIALMKNIWGVMAIIGEPREADPFVIDPEAPTVYDSIDRDVAPF